MFGDLRPNMTHYSTIEKVDAALVQLEEHERSGEKHHTEQEKQRSMSGSSSMVNGQFVVANGMEEENGGTHHEVESDSASQGSTMDPEDCRTTCSC